LFIFGGSDTLWQTGSLETGDLVDDRPARTLYCKTWTGESDL